MSMTVEWRYTVTMSLPPKNTRELIRLKNAIARVFDAGPTDWFCPDEYPKLHSGEIGADPEAIQGVLVTTLEKFPGWKGVLHVKFQRLDCHEWQPLYLDVGVEGPEALLDHTIKKLRAKAETVEDDMILKNLMRVGRALRRRKGGL